MRRARLSQGSAVIASRSQKARKIRKASTHMQALANDY